MRKSELSYDYPEHLIAQKPRADFRIMHHHDQGLGDSRVSEINKLKLFELFEPGDVLLINDTKVEKRRVVADPFEILFVNPISNQTWQVLFAAREVKVGETISLPGGVQMQLLEKGLPQTVKLSEDIGSEYFDQFGEPALPPYIQKARGDRRALKDDQSWYQSHWAKASGSCAAPTASLHFTKSDLSILNSRGVEVESLTLHIGLGTFLPLKADTLAGHIMHSEEVFIARRTLEKIEKLKSDKKKLWALGTTVTRAVESLGQGFYTETEEGDLQGATNLFIQPGFNFKFVDALLTNFHQPESTLLALVYAFAGARNVKEAYQWAIKREFRLFSYGDLSVWTKS